MKKIKEIRLGVSSDAPEFPGNKTKIYNGYTGGYINNADSSFSRRMQTIFNQEDIDISEEENEDYEMNENILKKRIKKNRKYQLTETLDNISNKSLKNESVGDYIEKTAYKKGAELAKKHSTGILRKALDSTIMGIPIVDALYGTYRLTSIATAIKEFSDSISLLIKKDPGYFGAALIHNDDKYWEYIKKSVAYYCQDKKFKEEMALNFNQILDNMKLFILYLIETWDTIIAGISAALAGTAIGAALGLGVASAGTAPAGGAIGGGAGVAASNITTAVGGFAVASIPFERILFTGISYLAKGINLIYEFVFGSSSSSDIDPKDKNKMQKTFKKLEDQGGSVLKGLLTSPARTLGRLHDLYNVIEKDAEKYLEYFGSEISPQTNKTANSQPKIEGPQAPVLAETKKHSILFLLESVENDEETNEEESFEEIDLKEFSAMGGGIIGGYTGPLGDEKRKNISTAEYLQKEQIERMRLLEAYHQRTSNRLK